MEDQPRNPAGGVSDPMDFLDAFGELQKGTPLDAETSEIRDALIAEIHQLVCAPLRHYPHELNFGLPRCQKIANHLVLHYRLIRRQNVDDVPPAPPQGEPDGDAGR